MSERDDIHGTRLVVLILLFSVLALVAFAARDASAQTITFSSSWENATGTSDAALLDGGTWDSTDSANPVLEVVTAENGVTPVDGSNMLKIIADTSGGNGVNRMIVANDVMDLTADDHYMRLYSRVACVGEDVTRTHYFEDYGPSGSGTLGNFYWSTTDHDTTNGTYRLNYYSYADPDAYCDGHQSNGDTRSYGTIQTPGTGPSGGEDANGLSCDEWYRVEMHVQCVEPGCMNVAAGTNVKVQQHMRVYDESGTQVLSDAEFITWRLDGVYDENNPTYMDHFYDTLGGCMWYEGGVSSLAVGNNGQQGMTLVADPWMYIDAVAYATDDWVGPVGSAPAPDPPPGSGGGSGGGGGLTPHDKGMLPSLFDMCDDDPGNGTIDMRDVWRVLRSVGTNCEVLLP